MLPLVGTEPMPLLILQAVVLLEVQLRVDEPPAEIDAGEAANEPMDGAPPTAVTVTVMGPAVVAGLLPFTQLALKV